MKNILVAISLYSLCIAACNRQAKTTTGFIKAGKLNIYYESTGSGTPLILLHAGLQDLRMWDAQVAAFSGSYKVIAIDLPGHGRTTGVDTTYFIADAIKAVMDSLKIQKASVMGLSLGSVSATDFVLAYPQMVKKVILVSPGLNGWAKYFAMDTVSRKYLNAMDSAFDTNDSNKIAQQFTKTWCDGPYRQPGAVTPSARNYILQTSLVNIREHHLTGFPHLATPPAADRLTEIRNHVLIIDGDKDLGLILSIGKLLHKSIPGARHITFPGVAHMLNLEVPADFNKAVLQFLKE